MNAFRRVFDKKTLITLTKEGIIEKKIFISNKQQYLINTIYIHLIVTKSRRRKKAQIISSI